MALEQRHLFRCQCCQGGTSVAGQERDSLASYQARERCQTGSDTVIEGGRRGGKKRTGDKEDCENKEKQSCDPRRFDTKRGLQTMGCRRNKKQAGCVCEEKETFVNAPIKCNQAAWWACCKVWEKSVKNKNALALWCDFFFLRFFKKLLY